MIKYGNEFLIKKMPSRVWIRRKPISNLVIDDIVAEGRNTVKNKGKEEEKPLIPIISFLDRK